MWASTSFVNNTKNSPLERGGSEADGVCCTQQISPPPSHQNSPTLWASTSFGLDFSSLGQAAENALDGDNKTQPKWKDGVNNSSFTSGASGDNYAGSGTNYVRPNIDVGGTFIVNANNMNLEGMIHAKDMDIDLSGDLNITTVLDTYQGGGSSSNFNGGKNNIGFGIGDKDDSKAWADSNQVAGLYASNTANIDVDGTTTLIGGAITADELNLTTSDLVVKDLKIHDTSKDVSIGAGVNLNNFDDNEKNNSNSYGNISYQDKGHTLEGEINSTIASNSGTITIGGKQLSDAELEARGVNTDLDKIHIITKDENWDRDLSAELVNMGVAKQQVKDVTNAVKSLIVEVPDKVKAQGPNAEDLYRKAIANGKTEEEALALSSTPEFASAVRIRDKADKAVEEAGGWDKVSSQAIGLILQEESALISDFIYSDPSKCQSGKQGVGVCPDLYKELVKKGQNPDFSDPKQIMDFVEKYDAIISAAIASGKKVPSDIEALYKLAIQCAASYDRENQKKNPNASSIMQDYLSQASDRGGNLHIGGKALYNLYDLKLVEAAKVAKDNYERIMNDPNATEAEKEAARQQAESLIREASKELNDNYKKYGKASILGQSGNTDVTQNLLAGIDSSDRNWLEKLLKEQDFEKALARYEEKGVGAIKIDPDSASAKAIGFHPVGVGYEVAEAFEEGDPIKAAGIFLGELLPGDEVIAAQKAFGKFLKRNGIKNATQEDFKRFLDEDEGTQQLLLEDLSGKDRRNSPGAASHGGNLPEVKEGDRWLKGTQGNAGKVPAQVANKLAGREFKTFDEFRNAFWKEVANDPVLSKDFNPQSLGRMKKGMAPYVDPSESVGGRRVYELDHMQEIQDDGNVYDMNNIIIRTPYNHIQKGKDRK